MARGQPGRYLGDRAGAQDAGAEDVGGCRHANAPQDKRSVNRRVALIDRVFLAAEPPRHAPHGGAAAPLTSARPGSRTTWSDWQMRCAQVAVAPVEPQAGPTQCSVPDRCSAGPHIAMSATVYRTLVDGYTAMKLPQPLHQSRRSRVPTPPGRRFPVAPNNGPGTDGPGRECRDRGARQPAGRGVGGQFGAMTLPSGLPLVVSHSAEAARGRSGARLLSSC
jgi:hypothetical protein